MVEKFKCNKIISDQNLHITCRGQNQTLLQSWIRLGQASIQYMFSNYLSVPSPACPRCFLTPPGGSVSYLVLRGRGLTGRQRCVPNPCQGAVLLPKQPWPLRPLRWGWCEPCLTHHCDYDCRLGNQHFECTGWRSVPTNSLAEMSEAGSTP